MRRGFTMIELIFVIVILGILAAVALPRMVGVQEQARAAKAGELVSQLNSVVVPLIWGKAQIGNEGDVSAYMGKLKAAGVTDKINLSYYMEIPSNFSDLGRDLNTTLGSANCEPSDTTGSSDCIVLADSTNSIYIYGRDGNSTDAPRFWYSDQNSTFSAGDFNTSKSSF